MMTSATSAKAKTVRFSMNGSDVRELGRNHPDEMGGIAQYGAQLGIHLELHHNVLQLQLHTTNTMGSTGTRTAIVARERADKLE